MLSLSFGQLVLTMNPTLHLQSSLQLPLRHSCSSSESLLLRVKMGIAMRQQTENKKALDWSTIFETSTEPIS